MAVKMLPEVAIDLRERYDGVGPAIHMNKKNWISVSLNETLSDEFIQSLIDSSYNETVGKQAKKVCQRKKKRP